MSWPAVPLRATLGDWAGRTIAIGGKGDLNTPTTALLQIGTVRRDGQVRVAYVDMAHQKLDPPDEVFLPADLTISEAVLGLAHVRPDRAALPPRVKGLGERTKRRGIQALGAVTGVVIVLAMVLQLPELYMVAAINVMAGGVTLMLPKSWQTGIKPRVIDGSREVFASGVYAQLTVDETAADPARLSPRSRVDLVKERLGALRGDIVYRIENSALFDAAVPQTQRLELALMAWDEMSPDVAALATEVEAAFDDARRHAEELGLDHLPETARDSGRRAARAAHAALHGDTEGERETARRRVADILSSLTLYYLPPVDPSTPSLIGQRKQIEPR
ncbi:hypothetical protein H5392_07770 [Tessaracoccus sp. MC1865]|uniref:hypothetical protein n=1 Tax=unclassified Tessaracoccus TaxID=2635419 RepID=UPI00096CEDF6|nr:MULTISPECIES: hypothetical protein [unclassified Tessaracoccus]MBB1483758.1 hypothetical protein [Tessaracoccus sp. MC1865]MCG6567211.1 hypothetical protein [Tessaracoccus sp. ZS01]OMG57179.1 hypothetical protein BJN44_06180 [Tessaracoccus sp. ZS01]QTO36827.1 hypothetical protein J7D54_10140 [Tessaracoccus sp. MC1865]